MLYLYFVPFIGFQIKYDDDDDGDGSTSLQGVENKLHLMTDTRHLDLSE